MKVKMNEIGGNILDTIQFAHRHNKDQYNFRIEFEADGAKPTAYFSTTSFEIMDAIAAEWPSATIITTTLFRKHKMNKLDTYTIDYIDNGVEHFTTISAHSEGMAEDVFYETYGENMDILTITLDTAKEAAQ